MKYSTTSTKFKMNTFKNEAGKKSHENRGSARFTDLRSSRESRSSKNRFSNFGSKKYSNSVKIKVSNIYEISQEELAKIFKTAYSDKGMKYLDAIQDIFIPKDRVTNEPRQYGFVTLVDRSAGEIALNKLQNYTYKNKVLHLEWAFDRNGEYRSSQSTSNNFKRTTSHTKIYEETWVIKDSNIENPKKLENTIESFPDLISKNKKVEPKEPTIIYSVADLFTRRKIHKKKNKNKIPAGWVRIYFDSNRKPRKEYGPTGPETPVLKYDHPKEEILKRIQWRETIEEEDAELNNYRDEYMHYWTKPFIEIEDDIQSESEEEYFSSDYEEEYEDDEMYDDLFN